MDVTVDWVEYQEWLARERESRRWAFSQSWSNPLLPTREGLARRPMSPSEYVLRYYIGRQMRSLWKMPDDPLDHHQWLAESPWWQPDVNGFRWDVEVFCERARQLQADAAAAWSRRPFVRIGPWSGRLKLSKRDAELDGLALSRPPSNEPLLAAIQRMLEYPNPVLREKGVI